MLKALKNKKISSLIVALGTVSLLNCGSNSRQDTMTMQDNPANLQQIEVICTEPCDIPKDFIDARNDGLNKSLEVIT